MNHFGYGPESDETADYGGRADFAAKKQTSSLSSSTQTLVKRAEAQIEQSGASKTLKSRWLRRLEVRDKKSDGGRKYDDLRAARKGNFHVQLSDGTIFPPKQEDRAAFVLGHPGIARALGYSFKSRGR